MQQQGNHPFSQGRLFPSRVLYSILSCPWDLRGLWIKGPSPASCWMDAGCPMASEHVLKPCFISFSALPHGTRGERGGCVHPVHAAKSILDQSWLCQTPFLPPKAGAGAQLWKRDQLQPQVWLSACPGINVVARKCSRL